GATSRTGPAVCTDPARTPAGQAAPARRAPPAGVDPVMKDPRPAARRQWIEQAVEAVHDILRDQPPAATPRKSRVILEIDVRSQMKGPGAPVGRYLPATRQAGHDIQLVIGLDQSAVQLVHRPDNGPVLGKGRVQRGDAVGFIIGEYFFALMVGSPAAPAQQQQTKTACPNRPRPNKMFNYLHHSKIKITNASHTLTFRRALSVIYPFRTSAAAHSGKGSLYPPG